MGMYYLDLETTGFDPKKDKIVTIQYRRIDDRESLGTQIGDLVILKEWESSEEKIVKEFFKVFMTENVWDFIPVMQNHLFEFKFLFEKFRKYCNWNVDLMDYMFSKPFLDIKYSLIMKNGLSFKNSGLDKMTGKTMDGKQIPIWYGNQEYEKIIEYIKMEENTFMDFFRSLLK